VDHEGQLLYHYRQGGREFGTRIALEAAEDTTWKGQELLSPRVPIVQTRRRTNDGIEVVEEAFAVTDLADAGRPESGLRRLDGGGVNLDWAVPPAGVDPVLRHILVHHGGPLRFELAVSLGDTRRVALALCEGWWKEAGQRVQVLRIEGAEPRTVDAVAEIGRNVAAAFWFDARDLNRDGRIEIAIEAAADAPDQNTFLNGLWVFPSDAEPDSPALLEGDLNAIALARLNATTPGGPPRNDIILVQITNTGSEPRTLQPRLVVDTTLDFSFEPESQRIRLNSHETVTASLPMTGLVADTSSRRSIQLEALTVLPGESAAFFALFSGGGAIRVEPETLEQALASRARAVDFWQAAKLPYGRIQVPDPNVQALVDSSIRNIWQAREIKQGLPAFQVGPTCYRGLWIVDGAFLLEAATLVGAGPEARSGVAYELTFQQPDGRIEVMRDFSKENGIVLWTCVRHAQLTQDPAWLQSLWPRLEQIAEHIRTLRQQTLTNSSALDDGLLPAGFSDGGIGGIHDEYTNPYWNLAGLRAFIEAAHWLGQSEAASAWQREYDDFLAAFRMAAKRDMKTDPHGHAYLPIRMDGQDLPQRGQWAFCHAVYPGQIFAPDDPLVTGTLAMLQTTERQGMVYGTGWDATGIWNYFASFYGHAWLWQGHGSKAAQTLIAFANHAAPTLVWREEQALLHEPFRKVGDMPHNWASAEFIRLTIHLLALDRGRELHLLEGLPRAWLGPDLETRLDGVATPFGPLTMSLRVSADGRTAALRIEPLPDTSCTNIVVHRRGWGIDTDSPSLALDPTRQHTLFLTLPP